MKFFNNAFLIFLLILFIIISSISDSFGWGEHNFLENFQVIILSISLFFHLKKKNNFLKLSNKITFYLRTFLFVFIIYEELSFLTQNKNTFFDSISTQSELNFHNLSIFHKPFININLEFLNYSATLSWIHLLIIVGLIFLSYGNYFRIFKYIEYFFLEKKYAPYCLIYFLNILFSSIIRKLFIPSFNTIIIPELYELFFYIILYLDVLSKNSIILSRLKSGF